jgi:hypothetical protein
MELMDSDLRTYYVENQARLDVKAKAHLLYQMARGMLYLAGVGVVHRDLAVCADVQPRASPAGNSLEAHKSMYRCNAGFLSRHSGS